MGNQYKIDVNPHMSASWPVAPFYKPPGLFRRWQFLASYENKEQAKAAFDKLIEMPIILGEARNG